GKVFTSRATADLLKILLPDSGRLQEEEAEYRNRKNLTSHVPALPLYNEADANAALKLLAPIPNDGNPVEIVEGFKASFNVAGHILGASLVLIEMERARENGESIKFLFSGDLGHYDQPIVKDPTAPTVADYVMVESTYGNRLHGEVSSEDQMTEVINEAVERDAPILIPAFAIGRTQEILYLIRELEDAQRIPVLPVRVDSPMAAQATQIYNRFQEEHDEEYASILSSKRHPLRTGSMQTTSTREESKALNSERGTRIIISASGMMTGGRVLHHAMRVLPDKNATLVFVGYQAAGTTGRRILNGEREVKIFKEWIPVRCRLEKIEGFSAHADWKAVLRWLEGLQNTPKKVFTTHGEPEAAEAMAEHIRERFGWDVVVPQYNQTIELM
ncbi:MAG TPA: MBL fold metallo-hydrolase, partial [Pyrinomonadaceae bacterium]|nr:MBL fold metallo-hydrolase [Pyrinomonadaceae bacterium]